MVKVLVLRLLVAMMCVLVSAIPASKFAVKRQDLLSSTSPSSPEIEDPATRSERSTNLSLHASRKIQLFIKNRHLQLLPDGTVNGTLNASSNYTVLQRTAVGVGQLKIQGVATCMYLCMDACGLLYGSREVTKECIFREKMNKDNYNTYSSVKYSNANRTMYMAMNRYGQPRKLILKGNADLGKLASYARALTTMPNPEVHGIRHEAHHCRDPPSDLPDGGHASNNRCPGGNKKKKKKKKRKCTHDDPCVKKNGNNFKKNNKKCGSEDGSGEKCQRVTNLNKSVGGKKRQNQKKLNGGNKQNAGNGKNKKKNFKGKLFQNSKRNGTKRTTTTTEVIVVSTTTDDPMEDDYYGFENSTHFDWEDASTASIDESSTTTIHPD